MKAVGPYSTVLLTGARAPVTLELARAFAQRGCKVVVADTFSTALTRWSRSVNAFVKIPSPVTDPSGFAASLLQAVRRYEVDELIPTCEETFHVAMIRNSLPCRVWTMDIDTLRMLHDKLAFSLAVQPDMPVPETIQVSEFAAWEQSAEYVFKPRFSRFAARTIIGQRVQSEDFDKPSEWIAQRRIIGTEYCVYSVWHGGAMTALAIYHPRYRAGQGAGIYLETAQHSEISNMVESFGTRLQLHGQYSFDVIVEEKTNVPYVIECNPRATSGAHLLGPAVAEAFFGGSMIRPPVGSRRAIWYAMAMYHPRVLLQHTLRSAKDVVFQPEDPLPAVLQGLSVLSFMGIAMRHRCSLLQATTLDIEWNG